MPKITVVNDAQQLVETSSFEGAKFNFPKFNPIQSRALEYYNKDCNFIASTLTGSGKTVISELFILNEVRKNKRKALCLFPFKSLAQQKYDDWTDEFHHFKDLKISICTGDYRLTDSRIEEINNSNIVLMSYEMLNHRINHITSDKSDFLHQVGTFVIDELHTVGTDEDRGHHLECGIMKFTKVNPNCRIVGLSGTMPNSEEIAQWLSNLVKKETILLKSKYRPVPVNFHFEKYNDKGKYNQVEEEKVSLALDIIQEHKDDKFLVFLHTKKTAKLLKKILDDEGIESDFHNADLDKTKRVKLENRFLKDKDFRVLLSTSTLSSGINTCARRVIVIGCHRGMKEVKASEILQEMGRAARQGFDTCGDSYCLIPASEATYHKNRLLNPENIESKMLEKTGNCYKNLAFHIVSEIAQEQITDREELRDWYSRSLGCFQANSLESDVLESTLKILKSCGIIFEEDDGYLTATSVGKIASLYYYSPFDVADFKRNFNFVFEKDKQKSDLYVAYALANTDTYRTGICSKAEKEQIGSFDQELRSTFEKTEPLKDGVVKAAYVYHSLLNGISSEIFGSFSNQLKMDFPRTNQVLISLNSFLGNKWDKEFFRKLELRMAYGVKDHLLDLCQLPEVGKARSQKLYAAGIKTIDDVLKNKEKTKKILGLKAEIIDNIMKKATELSYGS